MIEFCIKGTKSTVFLLPLTSIAVKFGRKNMDAGINIVCGVIQMDLIFGC